MRKTVLFILFIRTVIFLCLDLSSCKKDSPTVSSTSDTTEPLGFREAFYPMAVGNSWTYIDSTITDSQTTVSVYTDTIIGYHNYIFGTDWKFLRRSGGKAIGGYSLIEINDRIYQIQYSWTSPILALQYFDSVGQDSVPFHSYIGGDAGLEKLFVRVKGTYATPASEFADCIIVKYSLMETDRADIFCPHIGIVGRENTDFNLEHSKLESMEHARLLRYHLVK